MVKENKIIFGRSKSIFFIPLIDYPLQYMEKLLPSYSYLYFFRAFFFKTFLLFFCVLFQKIFFIHFPIFC